MRTKVRIAATTGALALLAVLAGCPTKTTVGDAAVAKCKGANTASTCDANGVCTVAVTVESDGAIAVDPYTLLVGDGPRTIVWKLNTSGYEFTKADGPKKIKNDKDGKDNEVPANFKDGTPVAKEDGSEAVEKGKLYKLAYTNVHNKKKWKYEIQLRSVPGAKVLSCDPFINSEGG